MGVKLILDFGISRTLKSSVFIEALLFHQATVLSVSTRFWLNSSHVKYNALVFVEFQNTSVYVSLCWGVCIAYFSLGEIWCYSLKTTRSWSHLSIEITATTSHTMVFRRLLTLIQVYSSVGRYRRWFGLYSCGSKRVVQSALIVSVLRASTADMDLWIWRRCDVVVIVHHLSSWPRVSSTRSDRFCWPSSFY